MNGGEVAPGPVSEVAVTRVRRRRSRGRRATAGLLVAAVAALGVAAALDGRPDRASTPAVAGRLGTPVLSARRVPGWTTRPFVRRQLSAAVVPVIAAAPPATCVEIGDGTSSWFAHNPSLTLAPASNMKLLTSAAAIGLLGSGTTLTTRLMADTAPSAGTVSGNLYFVGGGDPLLTTEAYQGRQRYGRLPETDLEGVADQLVAGGLRQVTGSVVGDGSRYDDQQSIPTWPQRHRANGTIAPLSALLVNDAWEIDPVTGAGGGGPAADPAAHAAAVLTRLLVDRGVVVGGPPTSGSAPPSTTEVLAVPSLPVGDLVGEILRFSDNTTAELLTKEVGAVVAGEGSTPAGTAAIRAWAEEQGLPMDGTVVLDGSGLSYENRLTCDLLAAVLRRDGPEGLLSTGLAVPGEPGTLQDRFGGGEWAARLRAKTGTLNDTTALSGWLLTRPGATLDFAILLNTEDRRPTAEEALLPQRVLEALLDQPVEAPLADAGPAAVRAA